MRDLGVGDRLDQYEIVDLIARGAMGSVFKALDVESGEAVALKVPHSQYESDGAFFERFRREEETLRQIDHPGVVRVLSPREKSRVYLAMELVAGRSLASMLRRGRRLPLGQALDIARQLCGALAYLHERGIVHRDLKPENVHLTPRGGVKILDFGIALLGSARRLTWAGFSGAMGTPDYMAPEQIRGRRGDARTDVYALGTILYEMLTGALPYDREHPMAVLRAKMVEEPTPPSRHLAVFDTALEALILRAIARHPRDRHANAGELLEDLTNPPGSGRETSAHPAGGRGPANWAVTITIAIMMAGLLGTAVWLGHGRSAALDRAPAVGIPSR